MINFRFHLISLIAVFLALAVGVVMGYGVLGQPTVDTLQSRVDAVESRANQIRAENDRLRAEQSRLDELLGEIADFAVTNRLANVNVTPVAMRGVDAGKVNEMVALARRAGATAPGVIWLEAKWGLSDADEATELAEIVGVSPTAPRAEIRDAAARALAARLAFGTTVNRPDLLTTLDDAGFITLQDVEGLDFELNRLDGRPSRIVVVGGNQATVSVARGVLPLARAVAGTGRPIIVVDEWTEIDQGPARGEELAPIRDGDLSSQVSTIDNFDKADGALTTVLVIVERGQGTISHYGFGKGAAQAVPTGRTG